jgi:hypothetical protein
MSVATKPRERRWIARAGLLHAAAFCLLAAGGALAQECRMPQRSMSVAELLFGRNIGNRLGVTEERWSRFVATEITPRFPDGISVVNAAGQWLDPRTRKVVREPSKLVTIVLVDAAEAQEKIDAIVAAYKQRFRQQSVGVIVRPACVSF